MQSLAFMRASHNPCQRCERTVCTNNGLVNGPAHNLLVFHPGLLKKSKIFEICFYVIVTTQYDHPWDDFVGPLLGDTAGLQPGVPPDWRWPQDFIHDLTRWARALAWMPAEVSWAELDLDYEAFVRRAHPASPDHRLRGTRLPLGGTGPNSAQGSVLGGTPSGGGHAAEWGPAGALPLAPPPRGPRVRGAFGRTSWRATKLCCSSCA